MIFSIADQVFARSTNVCYDGRMRIFIFRNRLALLSTTTIPVVLFLILAGCGPQPNTASLETPKSTNDSRAAPVSNDSGNSSATETVPSDKSAPIVKSNKQMMNVADFGDAALSGKLDTVRQALDSGVDVNATDEQRRTALMLASFNGHTPVVQFLLTQNAAVDNRDALGRTALMFGATGANEETVRLLLKAGAEINAVDSSEGFTALMHAAAEGQLSVVQILLKHQADPAIRDVDGDTARDFASRNGHTAVVQLLSK